MKTQYTKVYTREEKIAYYEGKVAKLEEQLELAKVRLFRLKDEKAWKAMINDIMKQHKR